MNQLFLMADNSDSPPPRDKQINIRIDEDLYLRAKDRAKFMGGISAVVRAMLRMFAEGERNFDVDDLSREVSKAPPKSRKKKKSTDE